MSRPRLPSRILLPELPISTSLNKVPIAFSMLFRCVTTTGRGPLSVVTPASRSTVTPEHDWL